jgi:hypothetical protein
MAKGITAIAINLNVLIESVIFAWHKVDSRGTGLTCGGTAKRTYECHC